MSLVPMETWVVVVIAADGTPSAIGPFDTEYDATIWANENENDETGYTCYPVAMYQP